LVFVPKVEKFDWFGAAEATCMHCGKAGHKGVECPEHVPLYPEDRAAKAKTAKRAKRAPAAKKSEKAASDNLSVSTALESEPERVYEFGHLGQDGKGRKMKNGKAGVPDRVYHNFGAGDLYVGGADCDQKMLAKLGIGCIVSAQPVGAAKPKYTGMEHFRFPIADFVHLPQKFNVASQAGVRRALNPLMEFIESRTENGDNVLIQCAGGAQHAGACAIAWYMYQEALSLEDALAEAKNLRRRIYLNKGLYSLLQVFEQALEKDPKQAFRTKFDARADHKEMLNALIKQ
jgi:hypothetical protein